MIFKTRVNLSIAIISILKQKKDKETISNMSIELDVSMSYVEQVIRILKKMGIVNAIRGTNGGYSLSVIADKYNQNFDIKYKYRNITLNELHNNLYPDDNKYSKRIKSEIFSIELSNIIN